MVPHGKSDLQIRTTIKQQIKKKSKNINKLPQQTTLIAKERKGKDRVPERVPDRVPERVPDRVPDRVPERVPDRVPERVPDRVPDRVPERVPDRVPERVPDKVPQRVDSLARASERLSQSEHPRPEICEALELVTGAARTRRVNDDEETLTFSEADACGGGGGYGSYGKGGRKGKGGNLFVVS